MKILINYLKEGCGFKHKQTKENILETFGCKTYRILADDHFEVS